MSVSPSGLAMDVDRQYSLVKALDGNQDKPKQFFLNSGSTGSALEHSVPEQLWSTPDNPAYGISAVKALKIANDQGIPIYTINQTNIDTILPQLQIDADAKTDIRNAVNAGKEVTVSKTNITYNGWTGCGYIIIDPDTGAGAYMISGGMSGAILWILSIVLLFIMLFVSGIWISILAVAALVYMINAICLLSRGGFFGEGNIGYIGALSALALIRGYMWILLSEINALTSIIGSLLGFVATWIAFKIIGCKPLPNSANLLRNRIFMDIA
jgi:multisubunit Na+/H+ antiporter MnhE subunit